MLSLNDIKNQKFRRAGFRGGYMEEDVNDFLDEVESSYSALIQKTAEQRDTIERLNAQMQSYNDKIAELSSQVEQYRKEEDDIKSALVSAQKMRDASIREARHQAEAIVNDANRKANEIVSGASRQIGDEQEKLDQLKQEVSAFRTSLLEMYKKHLTLINALPKVEKKAGARRKACTGRGSPRARGAAAEGRGAGPHAGACAGRRFAGRGCPAGPRRGGPAQPAGARFVLARRAIGRGDPRRSSPASSSAMSTI